MSSPVDLYKAAKYAEAITAIDNMPQHDPTSRETTFFMMSNGRAVDVRTYDVVYRQKER